MKASLAPSKLAAATATKVTAATVTAAEWEKLTSGMTLKILTSV